MTRMKQAMMGGAFAVMLALMAALAQTGEAAEKKKFTYHKSGTRTTVTESKVPLSDVAGHELVQGIYVDAITSSDPEFNGMEERVHEQSESIAGTGTHRGLAVDTLRSGDAFYQYYQGSHRAAADGGYTYEGTAEIKGGTGKFKNAKGKLTYRGRGTPDGVMHEEDVIEIEY